MKWGDDSQVRSIVYVLPYLEAGGTERHVLHLVQSFRDRARIGLLAPRGPLLEQFLDLGVIHHEFPRLEHNFIRGVKQLRAGARTLAETLHPDIVHGHAAPELAMLTRGAFGGAGRAKRIVTLHGFAVSNPEANFRIANAVARLGRVERIITVSEAEARMLRAAGYPSKRAQVVYNGIPDVGAGGTSINWREKQGWSPDTPVVGAVGRLEAVKGFDVLLQSFAKVHTRGRLVIVGDGSQREELERQSEALGVADRVYFAGYIPDAERAPGGFDVMVVPSRQEALPLACLEAMAAGTPIVASDVGGLPEVIVDGETGLIVPPDDVGALTAAIKSLLEDGPRAREMGRQGRHRFLRNFHVDVMAERTWALYEEVLR